MIDFILENIERKYIIELLKEEQQIRYSKEIQEVYTKQYKNSINNPNYTRVNIEREIQKYILRKFGFNDDIKSLSEYWKIPSTYWHDEEVKNSIFYMKYNIFQYPKMSVEDNMIDCSLVDYHTNQERTLSSLQTLGRPLVILAGSMT
jgi:hypothetical protein